MSFLSNDSLSLNEIYECYSANIGVLKTRVATADTINNITRKIKHNYLNQANQTILKQVRTNIGLADTLIPSSFINFSYMGGTGPCDSSKIIFGNHVYS